MNKYHSIFLTAVIFVLIACTTTPTPKKVQEGYLKENITQAELNNPTAYKRYYYTCKNAETKSISYLTSYFPLSRESRLKENFGIYFQLDGGKAVPFDHIENRALNTCGSKFEVIYRSYQPIEGSIVDLVAHRNSSTYYKNYQGMPVHWLSCKEN